MHKHSTLLIILLLLALLLAGCSKSEEEKTEKAVPVKIFTVKMESISQFVHATGAVEGGEDVILYSKMAEWVEQVHAVPGQAVTKDQILVEQKNDIFRQGLEIANASLKTAEAQSRLATGDFERMQKLYTEKAISPQQFDQAKMAKEASDNTFEQAASMVKQAKEQLENTLIRAPFDGVAAAVYVQKNQTVMMGQPAVQIISPSNMKAKVHLTGSDLQAVKIGQRVLIKFPALPGKELSGRVNKINTAIDQITRTSEVEIAFNLNDRSIKSGQFGEFFIETQTNANRIVIPETALISQTEILIDRQTGLQASVKKFFLFVIEQNRAKLKEVKTGIANNGQIEVTSGLILGDSVIVVGQNIVKDGQSVNVIQ